MIKKNCFQCDNLTLTKRKNYICEFKHINMGKEPYYITEIPISAEFNYGKRVCYFSPKRQKSVLNFNIK